MYVIKTSEEISLMKIAGRITAESLLVAEEMIRHHQNFITQVALRVEDGKIVTVCL